MACLGENTVTDLIDAMLAPGRRALVEAHTAGCDTCRRLISELVRRSSVAAIAEGSPSPQGAVRRTVAAGTRVGRYIVRAQLGSGAMGTVFAAFDPELDRAIALKLLHPGDRTQRERIQNEARAIAKLSHPNVVAAYDLSELDGDLVLAMELVDGRNLTSWLEDRHPVDAVLDALCQAGRGLAAAHAAGIVHRDFKPDNIVVGNDRRVRVIDFGLAAGRDGSADLVGTPAYMAPEQFEHGGANAASDQFAFCVVLYEALYGSRPFIVNLVEDVAHGPVAPPADRAVPASVTAAITRGLQLDPARRFPSMDELLDALLPQRGRARTYGAIVAGAIAAIAIVAAMAMWSLAPSAASPCERAGAAFTAMWNPMRKAAIHMRFGVSGLSFAEASWRAVDTGMDELGRRWIAGQTAACEATRVRGDQSDQVLTLRSACLDRALVEADALATVFATGDRAAIERAPSAIGGLPSLAMCANIAALLAPLPPPTERDVVLVAAVNRELARGRALRDAARWDDARALAKREVEATRTISHAPTRAAALLLLGESDAGGGSPKLAEPSLRDAYAVAELGHDDLLAARVATELAVVVGMQATRPLDALEWGFQAAIALKRAGGDLEIEARLDSALARVRYDQSNYPVARDLYQQALDIQSKLDGPNARSTAATMFNLGRARTALGDNTGAIAISQQALAILEADLGPDHPDVAVARGVLASIQFNQANYTAALATYDGALAIAVRALGDHHPEVGRILIGRGLALRAVGRNDDAVLSFQRAIEILDHDGANQPLIGEAVAGLGDAERWLDHPDQALASYRRALAIDEASLGHDSEQVATELENVASVQDQLGHYADALATYRDALAIRDKVDPPDYFEKATALDGIGEAYDHLAQPWNAVAPLRRAVALQAKFEGDRVTLAAFQFALARVIWDSKGDRAEARALAATAVAAFAGAHPPRDEGVKLATTWLHAHR